MEAAAAGAADRARPGPASSRRPARGPGPRGPATSASGERSPAGGSGARGTASAMSSGSTASNRLRVWPNFIAPPLSSPSTLNSCSAARSWSSAFTRSAEEPPMRLPRPRVARPAKPSGNDASRAPRRRLDRASESSVSLIWWGTPDVAASRVASGPIGHPFCARGPTAPAGRIHRPDRVAARTTSAARSSTVAARSPPAVRPGGPGPASSPGRPPSRRPAGPQSPPGATELGQHRRPGGIGIAYGPDRCTAGSSSGPGRPGDPPPHRGPRSDEQVRVTGRVSPVGDGPVDLEARRQPRSSDPPADDSGGPVVGPWTRSPAAGPSRSTAGAAWSTAMQATDVDVQPEQLLADPRAGRSQRRPAGG